MVNRQPADWMTWDRGKGKKPMIEEIIPGQEDQAWKLWKLRHQLKDNSPEMELLDEKLDELIDPARSSIHQQLGQQGVKKYNELLERAQIEKSIPEELSRLDPSINSLNLMERKLAPSPRMGGTPEELRLAQDEWEMMNAPIGTGTGVDPRPTPGEWKNGVLEIPSMEGGKGLRIDLNNQPWMKKKKNGIKI